jgi:hypothetical protein
MRQPSASKWKSIKTFWPKQNMVQVSFIILFLGTISFSIKFIQQNIYKREIAHNNVLPFEAENASILSPTTVGLDSNTSGGQFIQLATTHRIATPTPQPITPSSWYIHFLAIIFFTATSTPQPTAPPPPTVSVSCLTKSGPLITISGNQTSRYTTVSSPLAVNTKIDARTASWVGVDDAPVILEGGSDICFSGGYIQGLYPPDTTWNKMHLTAGLYALSPNIAIENVRVDDYGDAIAIQDDAANFIIRSAHISYNRDDCIENDWLHTGLVDDSLLDGCYQGFSARTYPNQPNVSDGSTNTWTIQNSLIRLQPMEKVYKNRGLIPGHDGFFKWDEAHNWGPKLSLHNNIFRADQPANSGGLGLPPGKLTSCSNNIMVWLGTGDFPATLPTTFNGQPCFTITKDKSVWDNAVARWKHKHS